MENIFTATKPFYVLAKVLGLFPLSAKSPWENGKFKTNLLDVSHWFVMIFLASILIAINVFFDDGPASTSPLVAMMFKIQAMFGTFLISILFFYQMAKRHSIVNFFRAIDEFDQRVCNIYCNWIIKKLFLYFRQMIWVWLWTSRSTRSSS